MWGFINGIDLTPDHGHIHNRGPQNSDEHQCINTRSISEATEAPMNDALEQFCTEFECRNFDHPFRDYLGTCRAPAYNIPLQF